MYTAIYCWCLFIIETLICVLLELLKQGNTWLYMVRATNSIFWHNSTKYGTEIEFLKQTFILGLFQIFIITPVQHIIKVKPLLRTTTSLP